MRQKNWLKALALLVLALLLLSVVDRTQTLWFAVRAFAFLSCLVLARPESPAFLPSLAMGFAAVALAGFSGFDLALAFLAYGVLRVRLRILAILMAILGILGSVSLSYQTWNPSWDIPLFPFHNRNHYAVFAELALPLLIFTWRRTHRSLYLLAAISILGTALAGGSRAGAAILLVETGMLTIAVSGGKKWLMAVPATVVCASIFLLAGGGDRLQNPFAGDHRQEIWRSAANMIAEKPFTGWGAGEFPRIYPAYAIFDNGEYVNAAHSDWLEWATEFGAPVTVGLAILLVWWLRKSIHFYPSWGILMGALHASVDFPFHLPGFLVFAVALAGSIHENGASIETQSPDSQR